MVNLLCEEFAEIESDIIDGSLALYYIAEFWDRMFDCDRSKSKVQARPLKRPFDQVIKRPTSRFGGAPHNKQQFTSSSRTIVCGFCQLPGHH